MTALVLLSINFTFAQQVSLVKDIAIGTGDAFDEDGETIVATLGAKAFFTLKNSTGDWELWVSDGTDAGTFNLKTFESGQTLSKYWHYNGEIWMFADDFNKGEIWKTDGTSAGTSLVYSHPISIKYPSLIGGYIYFGTDESNGEHLWRYNLADATAQSMFIFDSFGGLLDMEPLNDSILVIIGADISTPTNTVKLFVSNTLSGTTESIYQLSTGSVSGQGSSYMTSSGGRMFFFYTQGLDYFFYSTDGTSQGTVNLGEYNEISTSLDFEAIRAIYPWNDKFYFRGRDLNNPTQNKDRLYVSDGSLAGTIQLDPVADEALRPSFMTPYKGELYFMGDFAGFYVFGIFKTDGTLAGTQELITGSGLGSGATFGGEYLTVFHDSLFFNAWRTETGNELWASDGTTAGTRVIDLEPGSNDSNPSKMMVADSLLFFLATTSTNGRELYALKYPICTDQTQVFDGNICEGESIIWNGESYSQPGSYQTIYTSWLGCDSILILNLTVTPLPVFELGPPITIGENDSTLLTVNAAGNSVLWSDGSTNPDFLFIASEHGVGVHILSVTVTTPEGCQYSDIISITVEDDVPAHQVSKAGIDVAIGPNPVRAQAAFSYRFPDWVLAEYPNLTCRIIDVNGHIVHIEQIKSTASAPFQFTLPTSGIYVLNFCSNGQPLVSKRIMAY